MSAKERLRSCLDGIWVSISQRTESRFSPFAGKLTPSAAAWIADYAGSEFAEEVTSLQKNLAFEQENGDALRVENEGLRYDGLKEIRRLDNLLQAAVDAGEAIGKQLAEAKSCLAGHKQTIDQERTQRDVALAEAEYLNMQIDRLTSLVELPPNSDETQGYSAEEVVDAAVEKLKEPNERRTVCIQVTAPDGRLSGMVVAV